MGSCYAKIAVDYALDQVGNECGKTNKYSAMLDDIDYFNTKKNGYADSCSIFVNACINPSTVISVYCTCIVEKSLSGSLIDIDSFKEYEDNYFLENLESEINKVHICEKNMFFSLLTDDFLDTLNPIY